MTDYTAVYEAIPNAKAIAWDECHKIYLLMDDEQVVLMRQYGYEPYLITKDDMDEQPMYEQVIEWYESSCSLRFVQAVETSYPDQNDGFTDLIPQGADWGAYDEENGEDDDEDEIDEEDN